MKATHQDLPATTADQGAQGSNVSTKTPASRIIGFTNNLIATSVVIVIALAVGSQLISLWGRPDTPNNETPGTIRTWSAIENCAIEFGDHPYSVSRRSFQGSRDQVIQVLTENCKKILETAPVPIGATGDAEAQMIADAESLIPVAMVSGKWRIFQVENPQRESLPMVIGLRDNCEPTSDSSSTRLVTWAFAIPAGELDWTTLVCRTSTGASVRRLEELQLLIPNGSQRTLGINGDQGGKLIAFTGGKPESVKRFFEQLAERKNWTLMDWRETSSSWQTKLYPNDSDGFSEVQIQLSVDTDQILRGLLVIEPHRKRKNTQ